MAFIVLLSSGALMAGLAACDQFSRFTVGAAVRVYLSKTIFNDVTQAKFLCATKPENLPGLDNTRSSTLQMPPAVVI